VGEATKMRLFSDVNIVKKKKDFEKKKFHFSAYLPHVMKEE